MYTFLLSQLNFPPEQSEIDLMLLCVIARAATAIRLLILGGGESRKPASSHVGFSNFAVEINEN